MTRTIVVLAAGVGSRFGGPKQLVPVGPSGESILDYNVHDAARAGFGRIVVVTRPELDDGVRSVLRRSVPSGVEAVVVHQRLPAARAKPYGTAHAVLSAAPHLDEAFAVANADDLYGPASFESVLAHIASEPSTAGIVGFALADTVPVEGAVSRALLDCEGDEVRRVVEVHAIQREGSAWRPSHVDGFGPLSGDLLVSMNLWALPFGVLDEVRVAVDAFLAAGARGEVYLPEVVGDVVAREALRVRLLGTDETWAGLTNPGDLDGVRRHTRMRWPSPLWASGATDAAADPE